MDNIVYQFSHESMTTIVNTIGNNLTWAQAEPILKLIRENVKEVNTKAPLEKFIPEELPNIAGK